MTDYQMRTIADALIDIGTALQEIGVSLLPPTSPDDLPPPIDPPPPPPIDPPPPVDPPPVEESEFMRAVVLDDDLAKFNVRLLPGTNWEYGANTAFNPFGESFGVSFSFIYNAPPNMASPLSLRNDENPFFQLFARGPTALGVVFAKSSGVYDNFDVTVDDLTNRKAHVVFGYERSIGIVNFWVDGVLRGSVGCSNIGLFPDRTPPLIINSTVAGHQSGDITPIRLLYSVGAAPTQSDVDLLFGQPKETPRFDQRIEGGEVVSSAYGEGYADKNLVDPMVFIDGRNVPVKQTRNNPPLIKEWRGRVPDDIGREVSQ